MAELSRLDKLASAQLKLQKFRSLRNLRKQSVDEISRTIQYDVSSYFRNPCPNGSEAHEKSHLHTVVEPTVTSSECRSLADYFTHSGDMNTSIMYGDCSLSTDVSPMSSQRSANFTPRPQPVFVEVPYYDHKVGATSERFDFTCEQNKDTFGNPRPVQHESPVPADTDVTEMDNFEKLTNIPTAATEKILQLSQHLNGILKSTDQLTSSFKSSHTDPGSCGVPDHLSNNPITTSTDAHSVGQSSPDLSGIHSGASGVGNAAFPSRSLTPSSLNGTSHHNSYIHELEERNVELASLLEKRSRALERTLAKLSVVQEQSTKAASQAAAERAALEQALNRDLSRAREQIHAHAQTVGVLVAEKTELLAKLAHIERLAEDREKEVEATNQRLQVFREQSTESERSIACLKSRLDRATNCNSELNSQLERLKADINRGVCTRENLEAELQETICKLNTRSNEVHQLESTIGELKKQLELTQIYTNQLAWPNGNSVDTEEIPTDVQSYSREVWLTERANLTRRIKELEESSLHANKDRNRLESQYKTVVSQLEQQLSEVRLQASSTNRLCQELQTHLEQTRRSLREKEEELAEFECELEIASNRVTESSLEKCASTCEGCEHSRSISELTSLVDQQQRDLEKQTAELISVKQALETANGFIREKDALLADRDQVLQTATSERTVLSRAVKQNQELKHQLTELQEAFVRLTTDTSVCANQERTGAVRLVWTDNSSENMDLTTELQREKHTLKKDHVNRQIKSDNPHSHDSVSDLNTRLELLDCLENRLRLLYKWLQEQEATPDIVCNLPTDLLECFIVFERAVQKTVSGLNKELAAQAEQNRQHVKNAQQLPQPDEWKAFQLAHEQLKTKFVDCMNKLERTSEDRNRLEAIVAQLEMEAATVGEYVTLFAHRRAAAANRAKAREELISRLIADRQQLRLRLIALRNLAMSVINSTGSAENNDSDATAISYELAQELRDLLDGISSTTDESISRSDSSLNDDEEDSNKQANSGNEILTQDQTVTPLEQLCKQALQHDCPHCQCCVGNLMEI